MVQIVENPMSALDTDKALQQAIELSYAFAKGAVMDGSLVLVNIAVQSALPPFTRFLLEDSANSAQKTHVLQSLLNNFFTPEVFDAKWKTYNSVNDHENLRDLLEGVEEAHGIAFGDQDLDTIARHWKFGKGLVFPRDGASTALVAKLRTDINEVLLKCVEYYQLFFHHLSNEAIAIATTHFVVATTAQEKLTEALVLAEKIKETDELPFRSRLSKQRL